MTSGTANPSGPVLVAGTSLQHEQIIEQQLARTRRRIKWVDLGSLAMGLVGSITLYLLFVIWIDHWVLDLGEWGRLFALLGLALGVTYYCAALLVPPLWRRINPAYAARAIEQTNPSLKNSLLNFLTFRRDDSPTCRLVYQALRQRAALDLRQVNVELAVDRTRLIRIGYAVVALMVVFAVYTILSPKNVFQTLHRVVAPWADVARPSRVSISDVQPANVSLVYGSRAPVSARIVGVRADESVQVRYSTVDRQTLARAVPMQSGEGEARFACELPEETAGLQQNLVYWIEAGDARSPDFELTVLPTPTILVDQITYEFPPYTGRPPRVVEREGAIEALEGTQVTIRARTNHPIREARIEFDVDPQQSPDVPASTSQLMTWKGQVATYDFTLRFTDPERSQPERVNYRLTFTTVGGLRSEESMIYRIAVFRDLPPEVAILTPRETEIELAADARQRIEIRALDPDYGLTSVVLHARTGGRNLFDEELLTDPASGAGQVLLNYDFSPHRWQLQPGDQVTYWVSADDNRTSPGNQEPDPNTQRTRDYTMTIIGPEPAAASESPKSDAADTTDPDPSPQEQHAEPHEAGAAQGATGSAGSQPPEAQGDTAESGQSAPADAAAKTPPEGEQAGDAQEDAPAQQSGESPQQADQEGEQSSNDAGQSGDASAGEAAQQGDSQQPGDAGQAGSAGQSGAGASGAEQAADSSAGSNQGAGAAEGASGNEAGQDNGMQGSGSSPNAGNHPGSAAGGAGSQQTGTTPGSAASATDGSATPDGEATGDGQTTGQRREPLHDGEAFERALEHFRQKSLDDASDGTSSPDSPEKSGTEHSSRDTETTGTDDRGAEGTGPDAAQQAGTADSPGGRQTPGEADQSKPATPRDGANGDAPSRPKLERDMQGGDGESSGAGTSGVQEGTQPGTQGTSPSDTTGQSPDAAAAREAGDTQGKTPEQSPGDTSGATEPSDAAAQRAPGEQAAGNNAGTDGETTPSAAEQPGDMPGKMPDAAAAGEAGDAQGNAPGEAPGDAPGEAPGGTEAPSAAPQSAPGDPPGDAPAGDDAGTSGETAPGAAERPGETPANANDPGGGMSAGSPQDGGLPGADSAVAPPAEAAAPAADAVNVDYARRATDLVLERLQQEQEDPDPALLESLGWTADELRRFAARWEELRRAAREEGPAAQAELDDALRSLGLRPTAAGARRGSAMEDQQRGLRDAGRGAPPPPEYQDLFNAYKKGAARGHNHQGEQRAP